MGSKEQYATLYISTLVLFGSDLRDGSDEVTDLLCSRVMALKGQREAGPQILSLFPLPSQEVSSFVLPSASTVMCCLASSSKHRGQNLS